MPYIGACQNLSLAKNDSAYIGSRLDEKVSKKTIGTCGLFSGEVTVVLKKLKTENCALSFYS